ncbi:hypothetical protein ElyMa_005000400 [Elysia marginata]|uniref:Uncharacterized protein n=1 Tax=Elysia marginata TaxID=1093978 RepID=A0AAV4J799_9GAST|nr:hypothetical protein ElyMa_005000400 [Elysia marginata]
MSFCRPRRTQNRVGFDTVCQCQGLRHPAAGQVETEKSLDKLLCRGNYNMSGWDSNPQPPHRKSDAKSTELPCSTKKLT